MTIRSACLRPAAVAAITAVVLTGCSSTEQGRPLAKAQLPDGATISVQTSGPQVGSSSAGPASPSATDPSADAPDTATVTDSEPTGDTSDAEATPPAGSEDTDATTGGAVSSDAPAAPPAATSPPGGSGGSGTTTSDPAGSDSGSGGAGADVWPDDLCSLLPAPADGLQPVPSDPTLRCMYSGRIDDQNVVLSVIKNTFEVREQDPAAGQGEQLRTDTVDGRKVWSWIDNTLNPGSASATFNAAEGSVVILVTDESKTAEDNRSQALQYAGFASAVLRGHDGPAGSTASPATSEPADGGGATATSKTAGSAGDGPGEMPAKLCSALPKQVFGKSDKIDANSERECILQFSTDDGLFEMITLRLQGWSIEDAKTPGEQVQQIQLDGRKAVSYTTSGSVPSIVIDFDVAEDTSLTMRYSRLEDGTAVDPTASRDQFRELAGLTAANLPRP